MRLVLRHFPSRGGEPGIGCPLCSGHQRPAIAPAA